MGGRGNKESYSDYTVLYGLRIALSQVALT